MKIFMIYLTVAIVLVPTRTSLMQERDTVPILTSIAEKYFDIWGILKMAPVKSVEPGNNSWSVNHIIKHRSKFLPLGFSKFVLVLIL